MAGRGFGKTRTGAEWARMKATTMPGSHGALVGATAADVRDVMVRALMSPWNGGQLDEVPCYEPSKRLVTWRNGSTATTYSADEPERLRGPQHHWAWPDELGSWRYPDAWDQLQFGLRLGTRAQACVTGTPRATDLVKRILRLPSTVITRGSTFDNAANLDATSVQEMKDRYGGTRLGRQELMGELLEDVEGALWTHAMIERARRKDHPALSRIVVAVDPAGSAKRTADEAGIVVAGIGMCSCMGEPAEHAFVLEDLTGRYSPRDMGSKAVDAYHRHQADRLVAEDNFGGQIVADLIALIDRRVAYQRVHASRGKMVRAEPVAALYEQGKVHHVGMFAEMEDEQCSYSGDPSDGSPGRLDALVWAITDLMLGEPTASFGEGFKPPRRSF
jgi:phage terminase large subunit-like protein